MSGHSHEPEPLPLSSAERIRLDAILQHFKAIGGPACCILEICCGGVKQVAALAGLLVALGVPPAAARFAAFGLAALFDFSGKGTLVPIKRLIMGNVLAYPEDAREYYEQQGHGGEHHG